MTERKTNVYEIIESTIKEDIINPLLWRTYKRTAAVEEVPSNYQEKIAGERIRNEMCYLIHMPIQFSYLNSIQQVFTEYLHAIVHHI